MFGDVLEIASTEVKVICENAACFLFHTFLRVFRIVNPHPVHLLDVFDVSTNLMCEDVPLLGIILVILLFSSPLDSLD